jgi:hypothetical protein
MPLKYKYTDLKQIPADDVRLYVERGNEWVLDAEGMADKAKLDEMRQNNIELRKQLEESSRSAAGKLQQAQSEKERLELIAQGHKPEEIEKLVTERLKTLRADWDRQFAAVTGERDSLTTRLTAIQIDQGVITTATRRGLRPTAIPDITSRARAVFKLVEGAPQAFEPDGRTVRYGRDGITPMTLEEWVDAQVADAPHLFEANAGGGAAGNGAGGAAASARTTTKNPFRKESWNLTEQMLLQKTDPQLASRLKALA